MLFWLPVWVISVQSRPVLLLSFVEAIWKTSVFLQTRSGSIHVYLQYLGSKLTLLRRDRLLISKVILMHGHVNDALTGRFTSRLLFEINQLVRMRRINAFVRCLPGPLLMIHSEAGESSLDRNNYFLPHYA